jgi:hypothetical protein
VRALNQPESWWGWHGYNHPEAMSITQIIRAGTMPPRVAALLWLVMERGASIVLAADPPGAGKTTILTALLAFTRPDAAVYFTRGWGETFRLPRRGKDDPPVYLMVNEISDHLPVYSWGPYVQHAFELMGDGYTLASTLHADTVDGVIEQLIEECDVPEGHIGRLGFIVPMFVGVRGGQRVRRVSEVAVLEPLGAGYDRQSIARWRAEDDLYDIFSTPAEVNAAARRLGFEEEGEFVHELGRREQFIEVLLNENVNAIDDVQERVFRFMGHEVVRE